MKYLALDRPHQVIYTQQFCDENERVVRPPFFAHWPLTMLTTVILASEGADCTRVTVRWEPREATAADVAEFIKQRGGMTQGWTGSFDKLETALTLRPA